MPDRIAFTQFMRTIIADDNPVSEPSDDEDWDAMIERIHVTGRVNTISAETYFYFFEVLPPKWFDGRFFAFAEGQDALSIFWHGKGRYYCRLLTDEETDRLCETSGLSKSYGS